MNICGICELPKHICACAEAKAYDKVNPFLKDKKRGTRPFKLREGKRA